MPALVSTPERRAEAGAGATGCALGSQMWRGKRPALAAKPKKMHRAAAHSLPRSVVAMQASRSSLTSSVPVTLWSRNRPISVTRPPKTAMVRYVLPASIAPSVSSCATHTYEPMDIISKNIKVV